MDQTAKSNILRQSMKKRAQSPRIDNNNNKSQQKKKQVKYSRLPEEPEQFQVEKQNLEDEILQLGVKTSWKENSKIKEQNLRKHEIYDNTYYIPNNKIRVLEIPMSSSLTFQMLAYYHFYYDILYLVCVFTTQIYKLWVFDPDILAIISLIITLIWVPVELARLNFAYKGNINETFPEMIAFIIFTIFFVMPFSIVPFIQSFKFPHERCIYIINYMFIIFELIFGFMVMCRFMNTQSAAFYLRTAPIIDKNFKLKYSNQGDIKLSREIALGVRKYDRLHDTTDIFEDSDKVRVANTTNTVNKNKIHID